MTQQHEGCGRNNANFRDLRDAWEVKSSSSTSTQKAGNCNADQRRRQLRQDEIYSLKQNLSWDREQTPILAWQRQFEEEGGLGGRYCSSIDEGSDDEDEAYLQSHRASSAVSSQSSATNPSGTNPNDIEEEAKRKLLAFLSKPDGMNWEDLVRSLASEKMEKRSRKSGRSRSTRSSSVEPPAAPMLNKIITVFTPAGSFDDGISEMDCHENARLSKKERKKRDRLETMIEGVVMGKISVDVGDSFLRKVGDRIVHVDDTSLGDVDEDTYHETDNRSRCATAESSSIHIMSKGNRDIIVKAPPLTTPQASNINTKSASTKLQNHGSHASKFSSGDAIENRSYNHIPFPPKIKSLSKLSSTFAPFLTGFGNSGAKRNASSPGTLHTTPISVSSWSTDNSGSDFENSTPIVAIRPAATETVHHHHHYHHHVTPDVKDKKKKNDSLRRSWQSHPSPPDPPQQPPLPLIPFKVYSQGHNRPSILIPPPQMSTDACPSPTRSTNNSSSSSCSGGGWNSAPTDCVSPPSGDVPLHCVGIAPRIMKSSGADAIQQARADFTWADSLYKGSSRKVVLNRKSKGMIPAEVCNRNVAVIFPPESRASESHADYAELVYCAIGKGCVHRDATVGDDNFAVVEKENFTRVVNCMNGSSTTISIEPLAMKDSDTSQNALCTSSTTITTTRTVTTNTMVACRTFNTSSSSVEVLPILI